MRPRPRQPLPPDIWQRVDAASDGSLYLQADGPPMKDWVVFGEGTLPLGRTLIPFIVIAPADQTRPSGFLHFVDRMTGKPLAYVDRIHTQHMYEVGAPVTTTLGTWQRYSANWAAGRMPPPTTPPPAAK